MKTMEPAQDQFLAAVRRFVESPVGLAITGFACASFAGLAQLLRRNVEVTPRQVVAAMLHSAFWGAAVALLLYDMLEPRGEHHFAILAVSILSGIGGATATDFVLSAIKRGVGVDVTVRTKRD